jgi:GTPase SAR1 family protein
LKQTASRHVWNVALLGDPKVGKSSLVKAFLQRNRAREVDKSGRTINMVEVQFPNGDTKKVIFHEIQTMDLTDSTKEVVLDQAFDAVCICFEHINYLKKFVQEKAVFLRHPVPKLALACKCDERKLDRKGLESKELGDMGIRVFAECSASNTELTNFTSNLQKLIDNPDLGLKEADLQLLAGGNNLEWLSKYRVPIIGGVVLSLAVVYAIKRMTKK